MGATMSAKLQNKDTSTFNSDVAGDIIASKSGVQPDIVESVRMAMKRASFIASLPLSLLPL
jgi:hypothetical protein